jgi:hypothetical protein
MPAIGQLAGQRLRWVQPSGWSMKYRLEADAQPVASLEFRSLLGSFATGESEDGAWTFKRTGFLRTSVTIRKRGEDADVARFANSTWSGGGTLHLPDGRALRASTNLWHSQIVFETEAGERLLTFSGGGILHLSTEVEIEPAGAKMPELPWIVMLGCYLVVMLRSDSGAAAAAAAG